MPVADERFEQIRPAEEGGIGRRGPADDDVITAAGAGVAAIHHEFLRAQPGIVGIFIKALGSPARLHPSFSRGER